MHKHVGNHYQSHSKGMNDKDLLLEHISNHPESYFEKEGLQEYVFKQLNIDQVENIISEIRREKPELIKDFIRFKKKEGIQSTGMIKPFLKNGGFTKIEKDKENERIKKHKREEKADKLLDLDLRLKTFETKIGKKLIIFAAIISVLSFLITVLTLEFWKTDESKSEQKNQVENPLLNKKEGIQKDSLN
jgi:hypothetical protein